MGLTLTLKEVSYGDLHHANQALSREALTRPESVADLQRDVLDELRWDPRCHAAKIGVTAKEGTIILSGRVAHFAAKAAAVRAAQRVSGVKAQIEDAFRRTAAFDAGHITVETEGRKVILSGHVRSWGEREEADAAAWAAPGVYEVDNRLVVAP